ncbi:Ankyrin repeat domain-containing protein 16 [Fasciola hepatica]|uniref:Ankyrin repeat domain-containing protein 16 n=1 Tax=Fasciola hepatica TaxID=6192 RepID=A0A4E0RJC4_FASHE|nr:Ankyrin repeat domain-containing protein 16 [Fasciola hepatica]
MTVKPVYNYNQPHSSYFMTITLMDLNANTVKQVFSAIENNQPELAIQIVASLPVKELRQQLWQSRQPHSSNQGDTPLHIAAREGHVSVLQAAHVDEATFTCLNYHRKQPLHEAAQTGRANCVAFLLDVAKVPVDCLKRADWTPMMLACVGPGREGSATDVASYVECVRILLEHGADLTFTNKDGWNCLQLACRANCKPIVSMLLDHRPQLINSRTHNGRTCLHCVVSGVNDSDCVCFVSAESLTSCQDSSSCTCSCCVVHCLLHLAPSLLVTPDSCGTLPLFDALLRGHVRLSAHLLDYAYTQEQLLAQDKLGQQAVHVAAESGQLSSVQLVVQYLGSSVLSEPTKPGDEGRVGGVFPLHLACRSGQTEVVQYITDLMASDLMISTANPSLPWDSNRRSPIWYAVVGLAGCGSTGIERRALCVRLVWNYLARMKEHAQNVSLLDAILIEELHSLLRLTLPDNLRILVAQLLEMCQKRRYSFI